MYVVELVENKEQILLAHNLIIKHEIPAYSHSFGRGTSYLGATHRDIFEVELSDVIAMREHTDTLTNGMYIGLPELLLYEQGSADYGYVISAGTVTSFMHADFPVCDDVFHFSRVKIRCMELIGCRRSNISTDLSPEESEILRNIYIYTKGYNSD